MIRITRSRVAHIFCIAVGSLPTMALACIDMGPGPTTVKNCPIAYDAGWPTGGELDVTRPAVCPFRALGTMLLDYTAVITVPQSSGIAFDFYQGLVENRTGHVSATTFNDSWITSGGDYVITVTGDYYAATGMTDPEGNGFDIVRNQLYRNSQWIGANVTMNYSINAPPVNVTGPATGLASGMEYELLALPYDPELINPVSWTWYVDGAYVGTTSSGQFTWTTGSPGSTQSVQVVVTDVNGLTRSASTQVTACSGSEIYC